MVIINFVVKNISSEWDRLTIFLSLRTRIISQSQNIFFFFPFFSDFPFSLRLPDVIGPYDNTDRFWIYQLWTVVSDKYPIYIREKTNKRFFLCVSFLHSKYHKYSSYHFCIFCIRKLSFVFSRDVVQGILSVISHGESTFGHSFNLAHVLFLSFSLLW